MFFGLCRLAVATEHGLGVFDLVRKKTIYVNSITVPSGKSLSLINCLYIYVYFVVVWLEFMSASALCFVSWSLLMMRVPVLYIAIIYKYMFVVWYKPVSFPVQPITYWPIYFDLTLYTKQINKVIMCIVFELNVTYWTVLLTKQVQQLHFSFLVFQLVLISIKDLNHFITIIFWILL